MQSPKALNLLEYHKSIKTLVAYLTPINEPQTITQNISKEFRLWVKFNILNKIYNYYGKLHSAHKAYNYYYQIKY
jgi:hypothetical protein